MGWVVETQSGSWFAARGGLGLLLLLLLFVIAPG